MNVIKNKLGKINIVIPLDSGKTDGGKNENQLSDKHKKIIELNTKLSNTIYSSVQLLTDKLYVDWDRVGKYATDELKYMEEASMKLNEIGKNYYQLITNFDDLKIHGDELPNVNVDYCKKFTKT
ncbi:unnamed protein product [Brachionus calyciflorus]|uniref:Uncharacterized protein n=1 Tax=Brachionus calyciflorus TaxID=104777 RepID=A0A813MCA2_9BILA|nr:unnamed protein product [Brachionus calyciflorus]